ncbi:SGNH/GDSL hydrolase family protein [Leptospira yanagawae]|uniref:SGNH/GDSL hydrolase family protein n=1 Tax=Leptospira yanagawae TaxID=293069 RepID=A0ABY2M171_9LEPT|nr:SGNH/GDSL hydrolase family protein [Leptospira yanagawae]TGL18631.1 SGNH/GDSL hydrolase family protein [Leptospira yanagawae]
MKKYTTKKIIALVFFLFQFHSISVYAQSAQCITNTFNKDKTFLTFYGDSLGDLIDSPLYGYFGWDFYLSTQYPNINWNVQNFAVSGFTTENVYNLIQLCTNSLNRNHYQTAENVALEIGGNDYIMNVAMLVYMPWKFDAVDHRVTENTRILIRMLRNPLRNKKVLLMGNFPTLAKSPTLGDYPRYFAPFKHIPNGQIFDKAKEFEEAKKNEENQEITNSVIQAIVTYVIDLFTGALGTALSLLLTAEEYISNTAENYSNPTGQDDWYWRWHGENVRNPLTHAVSVGLMTHQRSLEVMAVEENNYAGTFVYSQAGFSDVTIQYQPGGVSFLPLYFYFIRHIDASLGDPYVANHNLYSDPIHINHIGYYLWSTILARRVVENGWHNLPQEANYGGEVCKVPNCGKAQAPPFGQEIIDPPAPVVIEEPNDIDWILFLCLFTGKCW